MRNKRDVTRISRRLFRNKRHETPNKRRLFRRKRRLLIKKCRNITNKRHDIRISQSQNLRSREPFALVYRATGASQIRLRGVARGEFHQQNRAPDEGSLDDVC